MKVQRFSSFFVLLTIAALVMSATPALAQDAWISYSVKFVCNNETSDSASLAVTGKYRTAINIHNPHYLIDQTGQLVPAVFYKKAVLAYPQGMDILPPSCKETERLGPDQALAVTCANIKQLLISSGLPTTGHLEGFLVIEVPPQAGIEVPIVPRLDVVAVYTAKPRLGIDPDVARYDVHTIEVERVPPMEIVGRPVADPCDPVD